MTVRAEQILDAISARILAEIGASGVAVYTHRRLSLQVAPNEPAVSVDFGPEDVIEEANAEVYVAMTVMTTVNVAADEEATVRSELLRLGREVWQAVMTGYTAGMPFSLSFGLAFVEIVNPGGASEPQIDVGTEYVVGARTHSWRVTYKHSLADPGDG